MTVRLKTSARMPVSADPGFSVAVIGLWNECRLCAARSTTRLVSVVPRKKRPASLRLWLIAWVCGSSNGTGDLSLRHSREDIYLGIAKQLKRRQEREAQVKELVQVTQRRLEQAGIKAQIKGLLERRIL